MIEAITAKGVNRAKAICDCCGRGEVVTCDYERAPGNRWTPNEGQILRKMTGQKWELVKGALYCPTCSAKRKATQASALKPEEAMQPSPTATVSPIRTPTPKQIRLIILALEDAYDDAAKRFRGQHTDASIARDLGDGIMPGWVAEQREKLFGPAGNEEVEAIRREIAALRDITSAKLAEMEKRLDACVKAHDRRVRAQ